MPNENTLPDPVTINQRFLAKAAGMDVELPTAVTMDQMYLQAIAEGSGGTGDSYTKDETDSLLNGKVDKATGKGLSTNDFTDAYKDAVDNAAPQSTTYTKAQVDTMTSAKADLVNGKIPATQLPSFVDDVMEFDSAAAFPSYGESGKIYVAKDTNKTYRWGTVSYVEISESLALGETASSAYAGNKGKANADAIAAIKDGTTIDSFGDVETELASINSTIGNINAVLEEVL